MKLFRLIPLLLLSGSLKAQMGDTALWKPFELIASKNTGTTGAVRINVPIAEGGSIADAISQYSALFVKTYSPGNLASTSMRGMGAQHTAVLWNGINLQSNMNSNMDLNLLPMFFIDQAYIETGANASCAGNGAIAGAIQMNNAIPKQNAVFGEIQYGSFNKKSIAAGVSANIKKWSFCSRFMDKTVENDFRFRNYFVPGKPYENLSNSRFQQSGFMQELAFNPSSRHSFYANYWYLQTSRQLPPPMGVVTSANEKQDDYSTKMILKHQWAAAKDVEVINKLVFLDETINYFNDFLSPAFNNSKSVMAESGVNWQMIKAIKFTTELNYNLQNAKIDGNKEQKQRNLLTLYQALEFNTVKNRLKLKIGNRQLMADGVMVPSAPDFSAELRVLPVLKLKTNLAASYRLPSFNDLYWQPGGNSQLKPELGKKAEFSTEVLHKQFKNTVTVFLHHVSDWILWAPDPQTSIWRAGNAKSVRSTGIETSFEQKIKLGKFNKLVGFGRLQYLQSINTAVYAQDSTSLGKQLFYTPNLTGFLQVQYLAKYYGISAGAIYTGWRYTTADNNPDAVLPGYVLFNASFTTQFKIRKNSFSLIAAVYNLGNKEYQIVENRPMPLRNFSITIKYHINYD